MGEDNKKIPAFPQNTFQKVGDVAEGVCVPGMTLRDYFAAAALAGLLPRNWETEGRSGEEIIQQWGRSAYAVADSMLAARNTE